ncbi:retron Se72 family effector protein [Dickeya oryzae]|uniref:retron Se72 family effector protein n=1 Tax=Dickeya oryzae TaxID=1240404 RepID=UPI000577B123|nr:retron Se72 family effector protein [Dickeya oryzae]MBP2848138.1 retron Se72 family effector protein [Dickeya oryzae]
MEYGFVNTYNNLKGYGFIRRAKGRDVIFSHEDINGSEYIIDIPKGVKVTFDITRTPKGYRAINISVI